MTISKWLTALMCAGSALAGSMVTVVVQSNSECTAEAEQQRQQRGADASFEARPNTRGGVKGY
ncbi:hypothetical protein V2K79_01695 [Pseudomonas alliivorans]|uniref:Secreted protein n=1 Tax=Pseudomonas cannabina TaxID=86840 RepID=A0A3M3QWH2_PSECA|nr:MULTISPECIES: hypothetical protein [Pseudomonas syringae group]KTC08411.1 hypothetical protein AO390_26910 [Pseudomonas marginalis ICMP 11289]MEE4750749.1 hypothetical protein [Pseudomonas alliivorans]AKF52699.1 hypothetical protein PsyrH_19820 [Pseudomonas syringae pv. syringae HS191]KPW23693.1 hypothetical protein ALO83_102836 [Pseudomonas cannabina pv. alisalensis]MCF5747789.1 hypothetical protein [Pseudomonas tremae]